MEFSPEQQCAFNKYINGDNLFLTGPGGTGKTALIRHIYKDAMDKCVNIQVCAMTGCASILLQCQAKTVHSWAGIGLGNGTIEQVVERICKNRYAIANWKSTNILIIDEVSMMSKKLFEMLDAIARKIRRTNKPFGGMQIIFSGDFYQLPPVGDKLEEDTVRFCFESEIWFNAFSLDDHIVLQTIFRQSDPLYQQILNQIREGRLKKSSNDILIDLTTKQLDPNIQIKPTKLFPTRSQVDYINNHEMNKLSGQEYHYTVKYHSDLEITNTERVKRLQFTSKDIETELNYLKSNLRCDNIVKIKVGAQVMCVVNIKLDNGDLLCNGAQGIVVDINPQGLPIVTFNNGYTRVMSYHVWPSENIPGIGVSQVPLMLAWALTIHKSQGATLDIAEIDVGSGIFECGQSYVALSRVKSLEGLYLCSFDAKRIRVSRKVQEFYDMINEYNKKKANVSS
jgi:ATP-dependent DNA helicase PIF1